MAQDGGFEGTLRSLETFRLYWSEELIRVMISRSMVAAAAAAVASITDRGNFRNPGIPGNFADPPPTVLKNYGSYGLLPGAIRNDFSRRFPWCESFLPP